MTGACLSLVLTRGKGAVAAVGSKEAIWGGEEVEGMIGEIESAEEEGVEDEEGED